MSLAHQIEYAGFAGLAALCRALPRPVAIAVGAAIGELGWALRIRRSLVLANLAGALPAVEERERRRLGARAARNFGRSVVEILRIGGRDRTRFGGIVTFEGLDALREALAKGGGAIVVAPHLGPWGVYVAALAAAGLPAALLAGRQHNPKVDGLILHIPGTLFRVISKGPAAPREVLRSLHDGCVVMMVADQHAGRRGDLVPFLGRTASTLPLPAAIAVRHGTPVFALAGHRLAGGRHEVRVKRLAPPAGGAENERRLAFTAAINEALGEAILAHPEEYFWYHRRWRDYPQVTPAAR